MSKVTLINVLPSHQPFLEKLYRSTRENELQTTNWSEQQKKEFALMQFMAQKIHYEKTYPQAVQQIVLLKKTPVGRIYTNHKEDNIHLIDISLLPEYQSQGIGSFLLNQLIQRARQEGKTTTLQVITTNPALNLYQRLGFTIINQNDVRFEMILK